MMQGWGIRAPRMRPGIQRSVFTLMGLIFGVGFVLSGCAEETTEVIPAELPVGYVSAEEIMAGFGLSAETGVTPEGEQTFSNAWNRVKLRHDSRAVYIDGRLVMLGEAVMALEARLWISRTDVEATLRPLLRPSDHAASAESVRTIWIDAGHGGKDPGAQNVALDLREKDLALEVSLRLGGILKAQGFDVRYTRTDDVYVGLSERAKMSRGADLMVSIHFNAAGNVEARGTEVYALTPAGQASSGSMPNVDEDYPAELGNATDPWNARLAFEVQNAMLEKLGTRDRGVKRARFAVLRLTDVPAVLIEPGFLSNAEEAQEIALAERRGEIAEAIANGIVAYSNLVLSLSSKS